MNSKSKILLGLCALCLFAPAHSLEKKVDHSFQFEFTVTPIVHKKKVLIDSFHATIYQGNEHKDHDLAIVDILNKDGFKVDFLSNKLDSSTLDKSVDALIIVGMRQSRLPTVDSRTNKLIADWVSGGGSLLLVLGHYPNGRALYPLLNRFGINYHPDYAYLPGLVGEKQSGRCSHFRFTKNNGGLSAHSILQRSRQNLEIERVDFLCGMALQRNQSDIVLAFPEGVQIVKRSRVVPESTAVQDQLLAAMLAFEFGMGRVAVAGDQGLFRHLIKQFKGAPLAVTMNNPDNQNAELFVNTMRWLGRIHPDSEE
jgi:hypothetical protein